MFWGEYLTFPCSPQLSASLMEPQCEFQMTKCLLRVYVDFPLRSTTTISDSGHRICLNTKKAIKVIKTAISKNMFYVLKKPEPEIHVAELADSSVNLDVMVWIHRDHWDKVYPELRDVIKLHLTRMESRFHFHNALWKYTTRNDCFLACKG